jgi:hypothetical protein
VTKGGIRQKKTMSVDKNQRWFKHKFPNTGGATVVANMRILG